MLRAAEAEIRKTIRSDPSVSSLTFQPLPAVSTDNEQSARGCILGAFSALFGRGTDPAAEAPSARAAVTSFDLRVTFTGMCLFVPVKGEKQMHVLLPKMPGMHRHTAILQFDVAHLSPGNSGPIGYPMNANLANTRFALPDPAAKTATLKLCPQVVDLYPVTHTPIDPADPETRKRAVAAVLLGDGAMKAVSPGVCWEWDNPDVPRPIANQAQWTMTINASDFTVKLKDLTTGAVDIRPPLPKLHPITPASGKPFIELFVYHVPPSDLPPDADPPKSIGLGNSPPHFAHFYDLYTGSVTRRSPKLKKESEDCNTADPCPRIEDGGKGGSPYTCMVAAVDPPP